MDKPAQDTERDSAWNYCLWRFNRWLAGGETYNSIDGKVSSGEMRVGEMPYGVCASCGHRCFAHPLRNQSNCCDAEVKYDAANT